MHVSQEASNSFDGLGAENECMGPQSGGGLCDRRGC